MSYTPFKEVTNANPGSSTRYGSDDTLEIMKIFNAKIVTGRRPEIINPWRWSSWQEIKQVTEASVTTPAEANVVHLFLSATDNKLKLKKTGGTIINLEDIGSGTWSNSSVETFSSKTIPINTNFIKHSTTNAQGDILYYDTTYGGYIRLAKGTGNQVLATNAAATGLEWQTPAGAGGGGESNTASNVGSAGIGWFYQKLGVDLQFKQIYSPDGSINISDDTGNQKIDLTLPSGIARTGQQNTFGDFQNTFRSGRLAITNPSNSFAYFFVGSALTGSRNITIPLLTGNDSMTFDNHPTTITNKTMGSGTVINTDIVTLKHSTTNLAGELLVNNGTKVDRLPRGGANTFLAMNSSGTDTIWTTPSSFGGVKLPADGTIASTSGRWGAFYGGAANGMGMFGFAPTYARLHGTTISNTESVTTIYTAAGTNQIAEFKTACGFRRDSTCIFKVKWAAMQTSACKVKIGLSDATALPAGGSGTQNIRYDKSQDASGHLEFDSYSRRGIRFDAGASGLGESVTEVTVRFRKYGSPSGSATVNVRKGSDDSVAATIGTFTPASFGSGEQEAVCSNLSNTYVMVSGDRVSIEFPANASNGIEADEATAGVSGYTTQDFSGSSWSTTSGGAILACQIKCSAGGGTSGDVPLANASGLMVHGTMGTHTNYRVARNNGAASQTEEDSTKALVNTTYHTVEFNINATNCVVVIDGTTFTYTTTIPATTTAMSFFMHIETAAAAEKGLGISYSQVVVSS